MAKIKKCKICGKTYKSSKAYEEYVSDNVCIKCMDRDIEEAEAYEEYKYACGGPELFL